MGDRYERRVDHTVFGSILHGKMRDHVEDVAELLGVDNVAAVELLNRTLDIIETGAVRVGMWCPSCEQVTTAQGNSALAVLTHGCPVCHTVLDGLVIRFPRAADVEPPPLPPSGDDPVTVTVTVPRSVVERYGLGDPDGGSRTGAERYLKERLNDPAYRAAYNEASAELRGENQDQTLAARRMLGEFYNAEGVDLWMRSPRDRFGGVSADRMIADGRGDEVLAAIERIATGAYE